MTLKELRKKYYFGKRRQRVEHVMAIIRTAVVISTFAINCVVLWHLKK